MTSLIPAANYDGIDTCTACHLPLHGDWFICEVCGETVCLSCREEIGGMTHCPECAQLAREFINSTAGEVNCGGETLHTEASIAALPCNGQEQLSWSE